MSIGQTQPDHKAPLSLTLRCVNDVLTAGNAPVLRITVENTGKADEKVLKPRGDLQDTYYDLVIIKDSKPLDLLRSISDPGPLTDNDFTTLKPGQTATFEFTRYAVAVGGLPPGKYEARIRFWRPGEPSANAILSPSAAFTVK